jgi:hypothetical protein
MLGAAGGHGDYAGNEVDALVLNTETPRWVQLHAPSDNQSVINASQFFLDSRPSATHTYYATHFINSLNRMMVFASPGMASAALPDPPAGWPYANTSKYTFSFSMDRNEWDPPEYVATYPGTGDFTAALFAQHPITDDIYMSRNEGDGWYKWSSASNIWTKLSNTTRAPWYAGAAIDPIRNHVLIVGGYSPIAPEVRDLNGNSVSVNFTGASAALSNAVGYPGVIYDEANDDFLVLINNDPIQVYRVNAATFAVDTPITTGSTPARRENGIQNSVQYVPELHGIVMANSYNGNVYFMRTSP